jgi:hypothetical protein
LLKVIIDSNSPAACRVRAAVIAIEGHHHCTIKTSGRTALRG